MSLNVLDVCLMHSCFRCFIGLFVYVEPLNLAMTICMDIVVLGEINGCDRLMVCFCE